MGRYTKEEFLEFYDFEDEPEVVPQYFHHHYKSYENLLKNVKEDIKKGMRCRSAIIKNAGISVPSYYKWQQAFEKEIADGKTDTPLIRLFAMMAAADAHLEADVMDISMDLMKGGDSSMVQFFMKHRLGFKDTSKKEVELSNAMDTPIKFEIVDMTPTDNEEEED